ncbi:MAG: Rne/Rng family ribonuclease [Rhodospirillaceae bacterium]|jgi:ribonuclease G|nr:Rne/Rng family ribonuclease [Rhodospirillaceae bacterium]
MAYEAVDEIVCSVMPGEVRLALLAKGKPVEFIVEREAEKGRAGEVHLGRVLRVVPGLDAAFVDLGFGREGYLPAAEAAFEDDNERIADLVAEGDAVLVQIRKEALADKGPMLSCNITLPGRFLVYAPEQSGVAVSSRLADEAERKRLVETVEGMIEEGEGLILRTAAEGAKAADFEADLAALRALWQEIDGTADDREPPCLMHGEVPLLVRAMRDLAGPELRRVVVDDADAAAEARRIAERDLPALAGAIEHHAGPELLFDAYDLEEALADAVARRVSLPSGGELVIDRTEAFVAIDVNTARATGRGRLRDTIVETNREAAEEIARQIRLRNFSGRIVVDFISMRQGDERAALIEAFREAVAGDRLPIRVTGMTTLGLVEMTRRREREALDEALLSPRLPERPESRVTRAFAALREARRMAALDPSAAPELTLPGAVAKELESGGAAAEARATVERDLGRAIEVRVAD